MHVLAPRPRRPEMSMFLNVDTSVGLKGHNSSVEDILLVQFLVHKLGEVLAVSGPVTHERKLRMVQAYPTGSNNVATEDGIRAFQEIMKDQRKGTVVDGRVSVARGYLYGGGAWTIASLNGTFRIHLPNVWPRLQDMSDCPPLLKKRVAEEV
jgi:hypothetical protein